MGIFTAVPVWIIQDVIVYIIAVMTMFYIIKKEEHPIQVLMEYIFFILYAATYENFATVMGNPGYYAYGKSVLMIFNVPLSVPVFEFLILYAGLKILEVMKISTWCKPFIVGLFAVLADFSLDPVAVKQIFQTKEGLIGRWTWFPLPGEVQIYGEPVMNFTGWFFITGYAVAFLLLGRWWFKKSGYKKVVGYVYPILAMMASLVCVVSPLSMFITYMWPFFKRGGFSEWITLIAVLVIPILLLAIFWRGRMKESLHIKGNFPVLFILLGFPIVNLIFCIAGGFWQILWLVLSAGVLSWLFVAAIYAMGRRQSSPVLSGEQPYGDY
jgi:hypothetical protein